MKRVILVLTVLLLFPTFVSAHPGRTASDGCHYCRTNCEKWGVPRGERHCHGEKKVRPENNLISDDKSGVGDWHVSETTDPFDDSTIVTLILETESGNTSLGKRVSLILRCKSNITKVYIDWKDYLGNEAIVKTRIDKGETSEFSWTLSSDSTASFYPSDTIEFIQKLIKGRQLVAQVTPYNDSPVTGFFNLSGLPNVIHPLKKACNWEKQQAKYLKEKSNYELKHSFLVGDLHRHCKKKWSQDDLEIVGCLTEESKAQEEFKNLVGVVDDEIIKPCFYSFGPEFTKVLKCIDESK